MSKDKQSIEEVVSEFDKKFFGNAPDFHDPNTHQNHKVIYTKKMLHKDDLKNFIRQILMTQELETAKKIGLCASQAGIPIKDLDSVEAWKEARKAIRADEREDFCKWLDRNNIKNPDHTIMSSAQIEAIMFAVRKRKQRF